MDATEILFAPTKRGLRLAWSRLVDLGSIDSGSNPGGPTILFTHSFSQQVLIKLIMLTQTQSKLQFICPGIRERVKSFFEMQRVMANHPVHSLLTQHH